MKMFGNGQAPSGKMQRTTAPPSFDVYRSLPVSASVLARNSNSATLDSVPTLAKTAAANESSTKAANAPQIPYPPVPLTCLCMNNSIWRDEIDLEATLKKLQAICSRCELRRTASTCEFVCQAQAQDGNEQCSFNINVWAVPEGEEGAHGKYVIQVDRCAGCPYFFRTTVAKAFDVPESHKPCNKLFRVPKLPECFNDDGEGIHMECVENALSLATSDMYEQRIQGVCTLANLCSENNPKFTSLFKSADGPRRISTLKSDSDCCIKRAVSKILAHCA